MVERRTFISLKLPCSTINGFFKTNKLWEKYFKHKQSCSDSSEPNNIALENAEKAPCNFWPGARPVFANCPNITRTINSTH